MQRCVGGALLHAPHGPHAWAHAQLHAPHGRLCAACVQLHVPNALFACGCMLTLCIHAHAILKTDPRVPGPGVRGGDQARNDAVCSGAHGCCCCCCTSCMPPALIRMLQHPSRSLHACSTPAAPALKRRAGTYTPPLPPVSRMQECETPIAPVVRAMPFKHALHAPQTTLSHPQNSHRSTRR